MTLAITSLGDFSRWARGNGLEIVLFVVGSILFARFVAWFGTALTNRIDAQDRSTDSLVRSEAAKHRHSLTQVITWTSVALIYSITGVLVIDRFGVPLTSLIAPATVAGVALGFGAQRIVQDVLAGFFIITERQYAFGDLIRISNIGPDNWRISYPLFLAAMVVLGIGNYYLIKWIERKNGNLK